MAYDITDETRRARMAATLQTHGDRIQRSVFLRTIDHGDLAILAERLTAIIENGHDSISLLRPCAACWDDRAVIGQASVEPAPLYWAVL